MRINDQFAIATLTLFATFSALACESLPDNPGRSESTTGSGSAVETDGMSETGSPTSGSSGTGDSSTGDCPPDACTRCDALADECQNTLGCDVEAVLEACGQGEIYCGCPTDTTGSTGSTSGACVDASSPAPGELYGPCEGPEHACNNGLICQVADDPDPQFPKGTMCLTTCWGEGNDGTCPEALDSCGEPFAKSACQSATNPLRPVPCELPCASDIDCANEGMRCFLDRCVWEGL
jgi:hypothetical protein